MKPKLILGERGVGKTTRLLETVKWLKGAFICSTQDRVKELRNIVYGQKGYENVSFIPATNYLFLDDQEWDVIVIDEWKNCVSKNIKENIYLLDFLYKSKIQPVLTERLDTDNFDIEIME